MSKVRSKTRFEKSESKITKKSISSFIPEKYQTIILIGIIALVFLIYFKPLYFEGKTFYSSDILTSKSLTTYVNSEREGYTLWNPYIFCGMPAYALAVDYKWFNLMYVGLRTSRDILTGFFSVDYAKWTFYLFVLALSSYFLALHLTKNRLIGLFSALSTTFSTGLILFLFIGHVTKLTALCFFPLIFLMLLKFNEKIKLRDFTLLIIALQLSVQGWHVQIIFYTLFSVGIFYLYNIIRTLVIKEKLQTIHFIKSAATFAVAMLIAILIQADNFTQVFEYNPYSTRGATGIIDEGNKNAGAGGTDFYQYATNWSFSPGEMSTFIVPSSYGFGKSTYNGPLTQNQDVEVNTYFGQMTFVDVPMYMGIIIFLFGIFSIYLNRKNPFVQFLTILILIALFISFGRNLPFLYNLMFYYFPFFDKFRVPSMILIIVQLCMPILAALGLKKIIDAHEEKDINLTNIVQYIAYGFTGIFVLGIILSGSLSGWFTGRVNDFASGLDDQQYAQQFKVLSEYMSDMFTGDFLFGFGIVTIAFWLTVAYLKSKINMEILVVAITVFTMIDLIRIDNRAAVYIDNSEITSKFQEPAYISALNQMNDKSTYRILNLKQDGSLGSLNQNANFNAYFLKNDMYGYSAIKPRAFQDIMDATGPGNPTLWRMLNVKYLVFDKAVQHPAFTLLYGTDKTYLYRNEEALPRAYFVNKVEKKKASEVLDLIKQNAFNPKETAYTTDVDLKIDRPDSTASVSVVSYKDEKIELKVNASGNNLLFIGDTYYPVGWKALIDGKQTNIYRINHGFRGIIVPQGNHKIEFTYLPQSFVISKYLALILSSLTFGFFIFGFYWDFRKKKNN